ncbi:MAG TPA: glycosyltransferase [Thermoanaerobaculia bacterium]|nr:glycosyltransferase [Thermoanaerobaculia bacterium]
MRIGLDFRFLTFGSLVTRRGMGRFTQQQVREALALGGEDEYVLFCRKGRERDEIAPEIRRHPRVRLRTLPPMERGKDADPPNGARLRFVLEGQIQEIIAAEKLDVFHATTPFLLGDLVFQRVDSCPYVVTHYDLIPMVYPRQYFADRQEGHWERYWCDVYTSAATFVSRADRLAAISRFVKSEAEVYLGVPGQRIDIAYPFADPIFRPMPAGEGEAAITELRERLGLHGNFVVSLSHFHFSKNMEGLLRAFGELKACRQPELALVVVCELLPDEVRQVRDLAARCGVRDHLYLTGLISDDELVGLFNCCRAAVHVSRYEGFGLPALEAMQCGAAVVASRAASLPEIVGPAAPLVDPDRPDEIANAIESILKSEALRAELSEKGLERSSLFSGERLGNAILACYRTAVEQPAEKPRAPKLSYWSPIPPQQSGVADYSFELIEWLEQHVDLEVVIDRDVTPLLDRPLRSVFRSVAREGRRRPSADQVVFQFGASDFHLFESESLDVKPDLVTLHDLTWGRVRRLVAGGDGVPFRREIARLEGREAVREYDEILELELTKRHIALEDFFTRYFLLGPVISASKVQLVHFLGGAESLAARYPDAHPQFAQMGVADPTAAVPFESREVTRRPAVPSRLEVGVFGIVDPVKRIERLADAVAELRRDDVEIRVTVSGPAVTEEYRDALARYLRTCGVEHAFRVWGRVTRADFDRHLLEADVIVNLRWPFRQQMSATLMRAVAAGKPVIVTDVAAWRMFPSEFCDYIPVGEGEAEALVRVLRRLHSDRDEIERRGVAARRFYREHATLEVMGRRYLELLGLSPRELRNDETALPLPASGVAQVEHRHDLDVAWALEQLVPDAVELEERLRLAGGLGGALAESAVLAALLRRSGRLDGRTDVAVLGRVAPRLIGVLETECASITQRTGLQNGRDQQSGDALPPWATDLETGSADVVIVTRDLDVSCPEQLSAVVFEALRIVADDGIVLVSFWYRAAGTAELGDEGWSGTLSRLDVEKVLIDSPGAEAVEPFEGMLSAATLTAPREIRLDSPTTRTRPVEIVMGRAVCTGFVTLRRPESWSPMIIPPERSDEWGRIWSEALRSQKVSENEAAVEWIEADQPKTSSGVELASWDHSDLRQFLFRWNHVRARSGLEVASSGNVLARAGGFMKRTAQRIRDLGISGDRLRDLLVALVDRQVVLDDQQARLGQVLARLREDFAMLERRFDMREENGSSEVLERSESLSEGSDGVPVASGPTWDAVASTDWLGPTEMSALLRELEELVPALATCGSIELSFACAWSEDLLEVALRRFGDRIASVVVAGYRFPNDAWIVVDLGRGWPSAQLLDCAGSRLAPGGCLVLVTRAEEPPPSVDGVHLEADISSRAIAGARIVSWRRDGEDG